MRIASDLLSTGLQVEERNRFSRLDLNFAFVILALNLIGLINLYSATHGLFSKDKMDLFWMQLVWLSIALSHLPLWSYGTRFGQTRK